MARTVVSTSWHLKFVHWLEERKGKVPKQWNSKLQTGSGAGGGKEAADPAVDRLNLPLPQAHKAHTQPWMLLQLLK